MSYILLAGKELIYILFFLMISAYYAISSHILSTDYIDNDSTNNHYSSYLYG